MLIMLMLLFCYYYLLKLIYSAVNLLIGIPAMESPTKGDIGNQNNNNNNNNTTTTNNNNTSLY